jgi:DNA-binding MarR family transcriptional regulator
VDDTSADTSRDPGDAAPAPPSAGDAERFAEIQAALGVVARRAKDFELLETLGARVGYRLEGPYYGTLSRLGLAGQCTVTELAELLGLELSTVSRRVKALEDRGLVARETSPTDRRTSLLRLTAEGRSLFEALSDSWRQMLAEVLEGWDPFSIEVFAELFGRFAEALERYATERTGPRHVTGASAPTRP